MRVTFVHPDLGIGGAERLVVDAAVALQRRGHDVRLLTAHHSRDHCFPETADGSLSVTVIGDWLPRSVCGKCHALFAYLRMCLCALFVCFCRQTDVIVCDQISACIPLFRVFKRRVPVLFYCHFPDQLLTGRESPLKRLYRYPIDWLEEWSTGLAHCVCVNSKFTASVFRETFSSLANVDVQVLCPALNVENFDALDDEQPTDDDNVIPSACNLFLSVNRFERKKDIGLAVQALRALEELLSGEQWAQTHLVVAGGYDRRVAENVGHYEELRALADDLGVADRVTFVRSPSDALKRRLLRRCLAVLYTPSREHFGIVPLEAMASRKPVVAVDSGGPTESVARGVTGFLAAAEPAAFADCMHYLVDAPQRAAQFGERGRQRVVEHFSLDSFGARLDRMLRDLVHSSLP